MGCCSKARLPELAEAELMFSGATVTGIAPATACRGFTIEFTNLATGEVSTLDVCQDDCPPCDCPPGFAGFRVDGTTIVGVLTDGSETPPVDLCPVVEACGGGGGTTCTGVNCTSITPA